MKRLIIIAFLLLGGIYSNAQDTKQLLKEADAAYRKEFYRVAAVSFEKIVEREPDNKEALYKLGVCHVEGLSHKRALECLMEVYEDDKLFDKHIEYYLARAYQLNYQFDEAIELFESYKAKLNKRDTRIPRLVKRINECTYGKEFAENPHSYVIENAGPVLNTEYSEHSPVLSQDGSMIIFTSRKYKDEVSDKEGGQDFFEHIYVSRKTEDGEWGPVELFPINIGTNTATIQMYDNDTKMLIYEDKNRGDIYETTFENNSWSNPVKVEEINSPYGSEADAYVNTDGDVIVFTSNKDSEDGDLDLYVSRRADGDSPWGEPMRLGNHINTPYNEGSPFISSDSKTLFFSSQGHNSMGGYDVFRCEFDENSFTWGEPENLGMPINTPSDDIYFYYTNSNNWTGFFSSYREGGYGEKDLYMVTFVPNVYVKGVVTDFDSKEPVGGLEVQFVDEESGEVVDSYVSRKDNGKYRVNVLADNSYSVLVKQGDNVVSSAYFEVGEVGEFDKKEYVFNINVDLEEEEILALNDSAPEEDNEDPIVIPDDEVTTIGDVVATNDDGQDENILFGDNDDNTSEDFVAIDPDDPSDPSGPYGTDDRVEVADGGDQNNDVANNDVVSEPSGRDDDVVSDNGDTRPVNTPDGENYIANAADNISVDDNGNPINRTNVTEKSFGSNYDDASVDPLQAERDYIAFMKSRGMYKPQKGAGEKNRISSNSATADQNGSTGNSYEEKPYFEMSDIKPGQNIVLNNVYFDYNRAEVKNESKGELNRLLAYMVANPGVKIEIGGHTDNTGTTAYNKRLSAKRAQSVVNYLVKKGISKNRLQSVGYGESRPMATNDDEEEGRELNRRTEFRIIGGGLAAY